MGVRAKKSVKISDWQKRLLEEEGKKRTTLRQYSERIAIILRNYRGDSQSAISRSMGLDYESVRLWRSRWIEEYEKLIIYEGGVGGKGVKDHDLLSKMLETVLKP